MRSLLASHCAEQRVRFTIIERRFVPRLQRFVAMLSRRQPERCTFRACDPEGILDADPIERGGPT